MSFPIKANSFDPLKLVCHLRGSVIHQDATLRRRFQHEWVVAEGKLAACTFPAAVVLLQVDFLIDRVVVETAIVELVVGSTSASIGR